MYSVPYCIQIDPIIIKCFHRGFALLTHSLGTDRSSVNSFIELEGLSDYIKDMVYMAFPIEGLDKGLATSMIVSGLDSSCAALRLSRAASVGFSFWLPCAWD